MSSFEDYDFKEQLADHIRFDISDEDAEGLASLLGKTLLEMAEEYAEGHGLIDSEEALTLRFDSEIAQNVVEAVGEKDYPAMRQAFNDWTDSLCRDGQLHQLQYENYTYCTVVGEHARAFRGG